MRRCALRLRHAAIADAACHSAFAIRHAAITLLTIARYARCYTMLLRHAMLLRYAIRRVFSMPMLTLRLLLISSENLSYEECYYVFRLPLFDTPSRVIDEILRCCCLIALPPCRQLPRAHAAARLPRHLIAAA